jgi:hypothetical protein
MVPNNRDKVIGNSIETEYQNKLRAAPRGGGPRGRVVGDGELVGHLLALTVPKEGHGQKLFGPPV